MPITDIIASSGSNFRPVDLYLRGRDFESRQTGNRIANRSQRLAEQQQRQQLDLSQMPLEQQAQHSAEIANQMEMVRARANDTDKQRIDHSNRIWYGVLDAVLDQPKERQSLAWEQGKQFAQQNGADMANVPQQWDKNAAKIMRHAIIKSYGFDSQQKAPKLSVGQSALDKQFAKDYVAWITRGKNDAEKSLVQIQGALERLISGEQLTGPILGATPDLIKRATVPEVIDVRDQVEEIVQRSLRLILGAQFTQREGERLIARAYNENLDEKVNAKRVTLLRNLIKNNAEAMQEAADYFAENGTLEGYKGKQFDFKTVDEVLTDLDNIKIKKKKSKRNKRITTQETQQTEQTDFTKISNEELMQRFLQSMSN